MSIFSSALKIFFFLSISRIWDLSLEKDEEEEAEFRAQTKENVNAPEDLPPQLLFVHQVISTQITLFWEYQIVKYQTLLISFINFSDKLIFGTINRDKRT